MFRISYILLFFRVSDNMFCKMFEKLGSELWCTTNVNKHHNGDIDDNIISIKPYENDPLKKDVIFQPKIIFFTNVEEQEP